MTRKEAIKRLDMGFPGSIEEGKKYRQAVDMAISALTEELSEDGTLTVHVSDGSKVKRVFVMGDNIFGGLYYPDSAENKEEDSKIDDVLDKISAEINTPNRGTCDYYIIDMIEQIISEYHEGRYAEMTNGEVIKALFPNADYEGGAHFMHITNVNSIGEISIPWEWWNAPYKAESEDKE